MPSRRISATNLLLLDKNPPVDDSTMALPSTSWVLGQLASVAPLMDGSATVGTSTRFARQDHVHPTDTSRAPLASPTFTGTVAVPTVAADTNTTAAASTAWVLGQLASVAPLIDGTATVGTSTRFARQDHVHPTDTSRAPLASPSFTGAPAVPTAAVNTNTGQAASTAFVIAQIAATGLAVNSQTASYTAVLADQDNLVTINAAGATNFTIPPHSAVAWSTGHVLTLAELGAGQVTVVAGAGVTVHANPGLKLFAQYAVATAICIGTDTWLLMGNITS